MTGDPDLGDAADYILSERPRLFDEEVWAVLMCLGEPPQSGTDDLALALVAQSHPAIGRRTVKVILRELRAYASLEAAGDWDDA